MKRVRRLLFCLFAFSLSVGGVVSAHAEAETENVPEASGYSIYIQKYKIEDFAKIADSLPLDGTKADQVKDADGKALDPLPGMSYEITRVTPIQGAQGFEPVQGDGAFQTTITTDAQGLAHAGDLVQGMYQIVEKEHAQLKDVMEPVIVELPFPQQTGEPRTEVYIYPKSSVLGAKPKLPITKGPDGKPIPVEVNEKGEIKKLPQTSGNIGTAQVLLWILAMIVAMGGFGMISIHRKKDVF
ncbi:MAG: pilin N-terminal domain-containing protein [Enterococcus sp.]|uniref:pilin N-terminal domain-containing protein n=1 Tax=Enterococcus sp. TaxID=35783 RepID=UPI0026485061|nr:pilin N-terminal domain-containing protein [Enterococcus sp.]MDN6002037.1 pilin N-terminal domain-containing protein [Enterococcus sp.]MDN6216333.1 pilin N-terminal domain-containing protein [Enterococcus sp.]MDN6516813.1 pilin N-terminal domain-containing protein [Enterococcus sp.]MDN6561890.1 pilin N-terminal domain-containing protein [Enterococcus sp.]MDN6583151.1 pilin N-terminal domain-containing protein [Enterococcus sp.]